MSDIPNITLETYDGKWIVVYRDAKGIPRSSYPLSHLLDDAIEHHLAYDYAEDDARRALVSELIESAERLTDAEDYD
jgi:hypothetical protein